MDNLLDGQGCERFLAFSKRVYPGGWRVVQKIRKAAMNNLEIMRELNRKLKADEIYFQDWLYYSAMVFLYC